MVLKGNYLFIAGNALYNRLNQPAKRLPFALAPLVEQIDVVGYTNFYGGPPAPAWRRLFMGIHNLREDGIRKSEIDNVREIAIRKLHLPQPLEMTAQAHWIARRLLPMLQPFYAAAIISGPENCHIAERLAEAGRIGYLIYYDTDHFPSYVDRKWAAIADRQERRLIDLSDGVVCVSTALETLRQSQGARRTVVINNGVNFELLSRAVAMRSQQPHPLTLIYTGSLDLRWGVDLAIRALPQIRSAVPEVRLIIVGDGVDERRLRAITDECGVAEAVEFAGRADYERLPRYMAQADIGVATSRPNAFRQYASPMKIADYLAAGLVVLGAGGGDGERLIRESGGGLCIEPDPASIAEAVIALEHDRQQIASMSAAAVACARGLSWDRCAERLAAFMAEIMRPPLPSPNDAEGVPA